MPDDAITIKGGSLKIECSKKFTEANESNGKFRYDHPSNGQITSVEIDGTTYPANQNSTIVIHYEVP
jgi:hypothetical protein